MLFKPTSRILSFPPSFSLSLVTSVKEHSTSSHPRPWEGFTMGCSQVFKANFLSPIPPGLKGSSRTSHLGDKHRPVFAEQTMVPFQPVPGRQAGQGAASDSGPRFWAGQGRRQTAFIRCRKKSSAPKSSTVSHWLGTTKPVRPAVRRLSRAPYFWNCFTPP